MYTYILIHKNITMQSQNNTSHGGRYPLLAGLGTTLCLLGTADELATSSQGLHMGLKTAAGRQDPLLLDPTAAAGRPVNHSKGRSASYPSSN